MTRAARGFLLVMVLLLAAGCTVNTPLGSVYVYTEINLLPGTPTQEGIPLAERTPTPALPTTTPTPDLDLTPGVSPTRTPPPTFTPPPSPTPNPALCRVTVTQRAGMNKRPLPTTAQPVVGKIAFGRTAVIDNVVADDMMLWVHDAGDNTWFAIRAWGVWWVTWGEPCTVPDLADY